MSTLDTLKQQPSIEIDFSNFTDEQVDAVVLYIAKIAREMKTEYSLSDEQCAERTRRFNAIYWSWPMQFQQRIWDRVITALVNGNRFWDMPADAMIAATRAVEMPQAAS